MDWIHSHTFINTIIKLQAITIFFANKRERLNFDVDYLLTRLFFEIFWENWVIYNIHK